jgi:hypothetical protein
MISIIGLFTFLIRLTLALQSQVVSFLPGEFDSDQVCNAIEADDFQIHSILASEGNDPFALCEAEEEEKSESETESLAGLVHSFQESGFSKNSKTFYNPFFGNKALQGNQHLYDLFHSWKTHLS